MSLYIYTSDLHREASAGVGKDEGGDHRRDRDRYLRYMLVVPAGAAPLSYGPLPGPNTAVDPYDSGEEIGLVEGGALFEAVPPAHDYRVTRAMRWNMY